MNDYVICCRCNHLVHKYTEHHCKIDLRSPTEQIQTDSQPFPHIDTRKY